MANEEELPAGFHVEEEWDDEYEEDEFSIDDEPAEPEDEVI